MQPPSLLSRLVLVGACSAATAGWLGVRVGVDPSTTLAASQPVPVLAAAAPTPAAPAQASAPEPATNAGSTTAAGARTQPGVRDRSAWQPSPVPSKPATNAAVSTTSTDNLNLPSLTQAPPMGGAAIGAAVAAMPALNAAPANPAAAASAPTTGAAGASNASKPSEPAAPSARAKPPVPSLIEAPVDLASLPYTPMSSMFTTDKLEAMFDGGLPETRGQWVEQHFYSQALGREDGYLVWLPPGYETSGRRYASLYLLHGVGGAEGYGVEEWLGYALTEDLDRMLALGMIEPMIVVLPNGEQGYWMNHSPDTDGTRWADFVATDLVKDVDAHFRTDPARERRAIGGLSMGGHGALQIAMNHPDEFSIVGAHSPTIRPYETSPEFFGDPQWFAKYDPISLAEHTDAASKLAIWIDIGNRDEEWLPMTEELDHILAAKQDAVQFHVLEGEHEGWYWEYYLPEYLNFYSSALNATAKTPKGAPVVVSRSLLASAGVVS